MKDIKVIDNLILQKIPKKFHKYIVGIDYSVDDKNYHVVLKWGDGFERTITEYSLIDLKWAIRELVEVNRNSEW